MTTKRSPVSSWQGGLGAESNEQKHITNNCHVAQCRQFFAHDQNNETSNQHNRPAPQDQPCCYAGVRLMRPALQLSPRHQRILNALSEAPNGILSFTLREICQCQNVADEVMAMRRRGFIISCELEPYRTVDGAKTKIGRYRLVSQEGGA